MNTPEGFYKDNEIYSAEEAQELWVQYWTRKEAELDMVDLDD